MNDNDIIKALECCALPYIRDVRPKFTPPGCNDCPLRTDPAYCRNRLAEYVIDLINRQKAEIERLNKEVDRLSQCVLYNDGVVSDLERDLYNAKAEAIKEFAERLKEEFPIGFSEYGAVDIQATVYDVVKEMTEDQHSNIDKIQ